MKHILILCLLLSLPIYAAVYNLPAHLINIPIYREFNGGDIITGISSAFSTKETKSNFEFDANINYAFNNRLIAGLTLVHEESLVANVHYNLFSKLSSRFKIVGGITDITLNGQKTVSSRMNHPVTQETAISPYLVSSLYTSLLNIHLGFGGGRFQFANEADALSSSLKGLIFAFEIPFDHASIGIEFDGKDFNFGSTFFVSNTTTIFTSFTELGRTGDTNPQYNNQQQRFLSIGISHRFNRKEPDEERAEIIHKYELDSEKINQIIAELQGHFDDEIAQWRAERQRLKDEITRLQSAVKNDIRYIDEANQATRESLRQNYLSSTQEMSEKVLKYYHESFEFFAKKDHQNAIKTLQKAITLNPYLPQLFVRMGSIYYDLDLDDLAILQWEKAAELDPQNTQLKQLIDSLK